MYCRVKRYQTDGVHLRYGYIGILIVVLFLVDPHSDYIRVRIKLTRNSDSLGAWVLLKDAPGIRSHLRLRPLHVGEELQSEV
jgi:hypothetical protein